MVESVFVLSASRIPITASAAKQYDEDNDDNYCLDAHFLFFPSFSQDPAAGLISLGSIGYAHTFLNGLPLLLRMTKARLTGF
jgi:hypothetical protein